MSLNFCLRRFGKVAVLALLTALGCHGRSRERRVMAAIAFFFKENTMTVRTLMLWVEQDTFVLLD